MPRLFLRNADNTGWVDTFCGKGWRVQKANGSYVTMNPANTKVRNATNTDWITPMCPLTVGGWKINFGSGPLNTSYAMWLRGLLAEPVPAGTTCFIETGPNKGRSSSYRWIGTNAGFDASYHPQTMAAYTSGNGWSGYGTFPWSAVYQNSGVGYIYDYRATAVTMRPVSSSSVPGSSVPSATWYNRYFDPYGFGPGTLST